MAVKQIVSVADMKLSQQDQTVIVTHGLGSCLGVSMYDPQAGVGGLLHVMMPTATLNPGKAQKNPFMFVDSAVPAFMHALTEAGASAERLVAKVAGGAKINASRDDHFEIGRRNYVTLRKMFWKSGILINAEDVGGTIARTMYLEIGSGRVWLSSAGKKWDL